MTAPRRKVALALRSRDFIYLTIFTLMVAYHIYSDYSMVMFSSNGGLMYHSFLPSVTRAPNYATGQEDAIPLEFLTASSYDTCQGSLTFLPNVIHQNATTTLSGPSNSRKIPQIVHVTSKSRCLTPNFVENLKTWQFPDHDFYFHDDDAVNRLLNKNWPEFPHINVTRRCLRTGAGMADLWRYLVLWEYGGIYTDIDNAPGKFWKNDIIQANDDAFFVVERIGVLSQYFMAVSPKHPLMFLAVHLTLHRVLDLDHVGKQYAPVVTGPGALKLAFKYFMRTHQVLTPEKELEWQEAHPNASRYERVTAGKYCGVGNRSVTVVGTPDTGSRYVIRESVDGKEDGYAKMGMKHFSQIARKKFNESCLVHLWTSEFDPEGFNWTDW